MADETDYPDVALDEQEPDPLEQAATAQAVVDQMRREEAQLVQQPGRMYMGPQISDAQFQALPQGARVAPPAPAPLDPQQQQALQSRIAAATQVTPPDRAVAPQEADPRAAVAMRQFEAQRGYKLDVERGIPQAAAMAKWGPLLFSSTTKSQQPKIHFGPNGQVLQQGADGSVTEIRKPDLRVSTRSEKYVEPPGITKERNSLWADLKEVKKQLIESGSVRDSRGNISESALENRNRLTGMGLDLQNKIKALETRAAAERAKFSPVVAPPGTATGTAPPPARPAPALPMPKAKDALVAGRVYQTRRGPATWDGKQFVPQ